MEAGEIVFGASCETVSPTAIEMFGAVGLDLEHGGPSPYDSTALEELTRAAEAGDIELLVWLPKPEPALVRKGLDAGVRTILFPRIETAEELQRAVEAACFAYDGDVGDRGVGVGRSGNWAGYVDSFVGNEDSEVLVGTMIENERAVENVDDILAVSHLGFAFVGPTDLAISMSAGDPLEKNPERVTAAIDRTLEACLDAAYPADSKQSGEDAAAVEEGYQLVRIGGDIASIRETLGLRLGELREQVGSCTAPWCGTGEEANRWRPCLRESRATLSAV